MNITGITLHYSLVGIYQQFFQRSSILMFPFEGKLFYFLPRYSPIGMSSISVLKVSSVPKWVSLVFRAAPEPTGHRWENSVLTIVHDA